MMDASEGRKMADQRTPDQDDASDEPGPQAEGDAQPEVTSPKLEHLQQTIDHARVAAKAALGDQPDV